MANHEYWSYWYWSRSSTSPLVDLVHWGSRLWQDLSYYGSSSMACQLVPKDQLPWLSWHPISSQPCRHTKWKLYTKVAGSGLDIKAHATWTPHREPPSVTFCVAPIPVCPSSFSRNVSGTKTVCLNMLGLSGIAHLQHNKNRWSAWVSTWQSSIHDYKSPVQDVLSLWKTKLGPFFIRRAICRETWEPAKHILGLFQQMRGTRPWLNSQTIAAKDHGGRVENLGFPWFVGQHIWSRDIENFGSHLHLCLRLSARIFEATHGHGDLEMLLIVVNRSKSS